MLWNNSGFRRICSPCASQSWAGDTRIVAGQWPTLFNPITYAGMWRLSGIVGRVMLGGRVPFRPL